MACLFRLLIPKVGSPKFIPSNLKILVDRCLKSYFALSLYFQRCKDMSFTLSKLKIQKKILALFICLSAIQPEKNIKNLNVGTAVAYLADAPEVPIEVAEDE